jgi:hypothetical protein
MRTGKPSPRHRAVAALITIRITIAAAVDRIKEPAATETVVSGRGGK